MTLRRWQNCGFLRTGTQRSFGYVSTGSGEMPQFCKAQLVRGRVPLFFHHHIVVRYARIEVFLPARHKAQLLVKRYGV